MTSDTGLLYFKNRMDTEEVYVNNVIEESK